MRTIIFLVLLSASGCAQKFRVYTAADNDYDIRLFTKYNWEPMRDLEAKNNPLYYNEMNDKYIRAAVDENLSDHNFHRTDEPAELVVHYHIIEKSMAISREDTYYYHEAPWLAPERIYQEFTEGTLIIDIMEQKSNTLVWRGVASGIFNSNQPYLSKKDIDGAVNQIFEGFPTAFL